MGVILVQQYNLKKGLELFGDRADAVMTKELQQIPDFGAYIQQDAKELSRAERLKALLALMFIIEKRKWEYQSKKMCCRQQAMDISSLCEIGVGFSYCFNGWCDYYFCY